MYKQRFIIAMVTAGSALEWFGFTLFGMIAPFLIHNFVSSNTWGASLFYPSLMLLSTLIRPVGGFVFGKMGDRQGRLFVLIRTIGLMIVPLTITAFLPSYQLIGITALVILAFIFLLQGFSLGGEFPGSAVFLVESAEPGRKGYAGSWIYSSIFIGMLLASIEMYWLSNTLSPQQERIWGWRFSFLFSAIIAAIVMGFRCKLHETSSFHHAKEFGHLDKEPLFDTFHKYKKALLYGIGLVVLETVSFNSVILFPGFYFQKALQFTKAEATLVQLITICILSVMAPLAGKTSLSYSCKQLAKISIYALLFLAFPLYYLMSFKIFWLLVFAQGALALAFSFYLAVLPALLCSLFPMQVRCSGVSTSFNIAVAVFASSGNLLMTFFTQKQASPLWLAIYLICGALITLGCLRKVKNF